MANGAGKTTVMAMLSAWRILNKVASPADARFSHAVLVVRPNLTIREHLRELDPVSGDASVQRTRDLVPLCNGPQDGQTFRIRSITLARMQSCRASVIAR